jgi:hypothetical protein
MIYTTNGLITYEELLYKFKSNENIGIYTFKNKKIVPTYDYFV